MSVGDMPNFFDYKKVVEKMAETRIGTYPPPLDLCEDEGCPHHGTLHVCYTRADGLTGKSINDMMTTTVCLNPMVVPDTVPRIAPNVVNPSTSPPNYWHEMEKRIEQIVERVVTDALRDALTAYNAKVLAAVEEATSQSAPEDNARRTIYDLLHGRIAPKTVDDIKDAVDKAKRNGSVNRAIGKNTP